MIIRITNTFEIEFKVKKKMIGKRERYDFIINTLNYITKRVYFIQADTNIWWKPRKIIKDFDNSYGRSIGWLFVQVGFLQFYKQGEEINGK